MARTSWLDESTEVPTLDEQVQKLDHFTQSLADGVRIQYGGSVKGSNAADLLGQADIDGALVGGASLKAPDFAAIVRRGA